MLENELQMRALRQFIRISQTSVVRFSFPGQSGNMYETNGTEYFLSALNDSALRIRVLDQQPKTLDETLATVPSCGDATSSSGQMPVREGRERKLIGKESC